MDGRTGGRRACIANWFELNKLVSNGLGIIANCLNLNCG